MKTKDDINNIVGEYKYGFTTDAKEVFTTGKGLSLEVVKKISEYKGEPQWMTDIRVKAYNEFIKLKNPSKSNKLFNSCLNSFLNVFNTPGAI